MMQVLTSPEFWKLALPLLSAVGAWLLNERAKRAAEQYKRKEENYRELLRAARGFYVGADGDGELRRTFINEMNLSWLYCPDDVIKKGYDFLEATSSKGRREDSEKERALGNFALALRRDLLSRELLSKETALCGDQFRHFGVPESRK